MSRITQQLLRKRAEHNEGMLSTLQEVSLHQQQLLKIQNLDILCRHLKILYLQNNIIEKLENLSKLKQLEYLNVALNNISMIENLEGCESLRKLDFTVNFIDAEDLEESCNCLSKLTNLKELYMTGNPCEQWPGCQDYIIARVPQLETYNGAVIVPSQRIKAVQQLDNLSKDLYRYAEMNKLQKKKKKLQQEQQIAKKEARGEKIEDSGEYTKQSRTKMYESLAREKEQKEREKNPQKYEVKKESEMYNEKGQIRQCNEGRYHFSLQEYDDPEYTFFQLEIPKFMDTNQIKVNIDPKWVSVRVKGKLTQMRLTEEIMISESTIERSQITGELTIKMKKLKALTFIKSKDQIKKEQQAIKNKEKQLKKEADDQERKARLKLCEQFQNRKQQDDDVPDLQ